MVELDHESAEWIRALDGTGPQQAEAHQRLHELLLRVARHEILRRRDRIAVVGPELDDLAHQAAHDALMAVLAKRHRFRGESRFTTWAYAFVMFEVSNKVSRHYSRRPTTSLDAEGWERLPDRFGFDPAQESEWRDLLAAVRRAVDNDLTEHQRRVFVAIVVEGVPLDALASELGSNRNALYKTVFDARRKIRGVLVANGYLTNELAGRG